MHRFLDCVIIALLFIFLKVLLIILISFLSHCGSRVDVGADRECVDNDCKPKVGTPIPVEEDEDDGEQELSQLLMVIPPPRSF